MNASHYDQNLHNAPAGTRRASALAAAAFAAGLAFAAAPVAALPFTNGSFESGVDPGASFITPGPAQANTTIDGWSVSSIDYIGGLWEASDGTRSIDLNAVAAGSVSQTFDTVAGTEYQILFDMAGNPDGGPALRTLRVMAGFTMQDFTFDVTGATKSNMGWSERSMLFTAMGTSTTLTFQSLLGGAYGPALDNVRVSTAQAVPTPAAGALMGLAALVGLVRRGRRAIT